jgi:uncharacterized Zn-finger protein
MFSFLDSLTRCRPSVCPICDKGFITADKLKAHVRTHTGDRPFVCDFCNKSFITADGLRCHRVTFCPHSTMILL